MPLRSSFRSLLALGLLMGLVSPGCGGQDEPTHPGAPVSDAEAAAAAEAATLLVEAAFPTTSASISVVSAPTVPEAPNPTGEFALTCPEITRPDPPPGALLLNFDYGTGCTSQLSGQAHSGRLILTLTAGGYGLTFDAFTGRGYEMGGALAGTLSGSTLTLSTTTFQLTGHDTHYAVTAALAGSWSNAATPTEFLDDSWAITGQATVAETDARTCQLTITEALQLVGGCAWPVRGALTLRTEASPVLTTVDFGSGACDDLVTVTVAGQSRTIHLSTGKEA